MTAAPATLTDAVFAAFGDWSQPILTYYNDTTGERTELSGATLGNWAAKTANYLRDELGSGAGDTVIVDLPEHWQTAAILLGSWWAGVTVALPADATEAGDALAVFTSRDKLESYRDAAELLVASLDPFALPISGLPSGVNDYALTVRVHGDQFRSSPAAGAVIATTGLLPVLNSARESANAHGIAPGARVLGRGSWNTPDGLIAEFVAPLLAGASLVHCQGGDDSTLPERISSERISIVLG